MLKNTTISRVWHNLLRKIKKVSYDGCFQYSVVTTVYDGVEKHLDDYFLSLVNQTINFKKHIQLILIDNYSSDGSADIIKSWQLKYPQNIIFLKKENSGQVSARKLGINYAKGNWITFIEPYDFIDNKYFEKVDKFARKEKHKNIGLISCNILIFREDLNEFFDSHPLKYRFKRGNRAFPAKNPEKFIEQKAGSAFFKLELVKLSKPLMDESKNIIFEDGHFVSRYLLAYPDMDIGVVAKARYYNRKPIDGKSYLKAEKRYPGFSYEQLELGYLLILKEVKEEFGFIPQWLQRTVFYDAALRIRKLSKGHDSASILSGKGKLEKYIDLVREIFSFIDDDVIKDFKNAKITDSLKSGVLTLFKKRQGFYSGINVAAIDKKRMLLKLNYYYHGDQFTEEFYIDNKKVLPAFSKYVRHKFLGYDFSRERIVWLPYDGFNTKSTISAQINGKPIALFAEKNRPKKFLSLKNISAYFKPEKVEGSDIPFKHRLIRYLAGTWVVSNTFKKAWLLMDRDIYADDNAEHLYRYLQKNRPDINAYFIIKKASHDGKRLKKAGFKLIWFGSLKHSLALMNARHVITSHITKYAIDFLDKRFYRDRVKYNVIYLKHGVIVHDMSSRINKKPIDLFLTASNREYQSIVDNNSSYTFCKKEVVLTGIPRHDALLEHNKNKEKMLLIMPTWRRSLIGGGVGLSSDRLFNSELQNSDYVQGWKSILHSQLLKNIVKNHDFKVVFFPHAYLKLYIQYFAPPDYIEVMHHSASYSIQHFFQRASCLITDYSSVAFEMAYLQKPVLYYQFDNDFFFSGGHSFKKGYFDYKRDGFGPVCYNQTSLLNELQGLFERDCLPDSEYLKRMKVFFAYRDGRCCERTVSEIITIEKPYKR